MWPLLGVDEAWLQTEICQQNGRPEWPNCTLNPPPFRLCIFICYIPLLSFNVCMSCLSHVFKKKKRCFKKKKKIMNHSSFISSVQPWKLCQYSPKRSLSCLVNYFFIKCFVPGASCVFAKNLSSSKALLPDWRSGFHGGWLTSLPCRCKARLLFSAVEDDDVLGVCVCACVCVCCFQTWN